MQDHALPLRLSYQIRATSGCGKRVAHIRQKSWIMRSSWEIDVLLAWHSTVQHYEDGWRLLQKWFAAYEAMFVNIRTPIDNRHQDYSVVAHICIFLWKHASHDNVVAGCLTPIPRWAIWTTVLGHKRTLQQLTSYTVNHDPPSNGIAAVPDVPRWSSEERYFNKAINKRYGQETAGSYSLFSSPVRRDTYVCENYSVHVRTRSLPIYSKHITGYARESTW